MEAAERVGALPASWVAALRFCPWCSGTGKRERPPEDDCAFCSGTGDYFGALLLAAYHAGRDDALGSFRELYRHLVASGAHLAQRSVERDVLKRRVGL